MSLIPLREGATARADHSSEVIRIYAYATAFGKRVEEVCAILADQGLVHFESGEPYSPAQLQSLRNSHPNFFTKHFNDAYHRKLTESAPMAERVLEEIMQTAHDPDTRVRASSAYLAHTREMRRHLMPEIILSADTSSLQPNQRLGRADTEGRIKELLAAASERADSVASGSGKA